MMIQSKNYDTVDDGSKRPLMIGCSGGGGHIPAIKGMRGFLYETYKGNLGMQLTDLTTR